MTRTAARLWAAAVIALAACVPLAHAGGSDEDDAYRQDRIDARLMYEAARDACQRLEGNARDVCVAEARHRRTEALAVAQAKREGTPRAALEASLASSRAEYRAALERCEDRAHDERQACIAQARAARDQANADARVAFEALTDRGGTPQHSQPARAERQPAMRDCPSVPEEARHDCLRRIETAYRPPSTTSRAAGTDFRP
jgi:hypothetical protein